MSREEKHSERAVSNRCSNLEHLLGMNMRTRGILISFISGGDSFAEIWALSLTNHALQEELESERIRFISSKTENKGFALKGKQKFLKTGAILLDDAMFFKRRLAHYKSKLIEKTESGLLHMEEAPAVYPELSNVIFVVNSIRNLEQKRHDLDIALKTIRHVKINIEESADFVCQFTFYIGIFSLTNSGLLLPIIYLFITFASIITGEVPVKVHGVNYADSDHAKNIWLSLLGASAGIYALSIRCRYKILLNIKNIKKHINSIEKNAEGYLLKMADDLQRIIVDTNPSNNQLRAIQKSSLLPNQSTKNLILSLYNYKKQFMSEVHKSILFQYGTNHPVNPIAQVPPKINDETTISWLNLNSQLDESSLLLSDVDTSLVRLLSTPLIPITLQYLLLSMKFHTSQRLDYSIDPTILVIFSDAGIPNTVYDSLKLLNHYLDLPSSSEDEDQRDIDAIVSDTLRQPLLEEDQRANGPHRV